MMKYNEPEMEIITLQVQDVITTSGDGNAYDGDASGY